MKKIAILGIGVLLSSSVLAATPSESKEHHKHAGDLTYKQYMHQAKERFEKMDTNHDKVISAEERREYWKKMRHHHVKKVKAEEGQMKPQSHESMPPVQK